MESWPLVYPQTSLMLDVVRELAAIDLQLTHETAELRWGPATTVFAFASLWWIKGPVLVGLGGLSDGMRWPALGIATLVAISRPYLGVHFWADVIVGALAGAAIGAGVALTVRRVR